MKISLLRSYLVCFLYIEIEVITLAFSLQAVFKNYDHDKDGFISHNEFEEIAGNFPFIDSFCVLDADK